MPISISKRLLAIANQVPECETLADIGTDHGYLPVYLLQQNVAKKAIAADIAKGPLSRAQNTIEMVGLSDRIETRLSDGLKEIGYQEADCILISGMGGILIKRILSEGEAVVRGAKTLVLSPQSDLDIVRGYMSGICGILDEDMVVEDGKYYFIIRYDLDLPPQRLDRKSLEFGPVLIEKRHPMLLDYLRHKEKVLEDILSKIKGNNTDNRDEKRLNRIREIEDNLRLIQEVGI